jgi:hypothetical protein
MVLRFLFLACLISVPHLSLSQESGKEKSRVADSEPLEAVSKTGIIYVVGDVHKPMGMAMKDTGSITVLQALASAEGSNPTAKPEIWASNSRKPCRAWPPAPRKL